jgi:uncharacterized alkaline shock family protein YloU
MEIYALVGKSGTGKSYKSHIVAGTYDIEYVIDDGLLIQGAKIVAGVSAKREKTKFGAVRRAIFKYEKHRDEVRRAILQHAPKKLMIIGTSEHMIQSIMQALELTENYTLIKIEEISTPEEIEMACHNRKFKGKHVIPVPTFEIKKAFSGYFIDSIKQWTRRNDKNPLGTVVENQISKASVESGGTTDRAARSTSNNTVGTSSTSTNATLTMPSLSSLSAASSVSSASASASTSAALPGNVTIAETTVVRPTFSYLGNFEIKDAAVKTIVEESTTEVEGIRRVNSVELKNQIDGIKIYINVTLKLKSGTSIPVAINDMAVAIKRNIEYMTGFNVLEINTTVKALLFQAEV